jgi:hypothetical protein
MATHATRNPQESGAAAVLADIEAGSAPLTVPQVRGMLNGRNGTRPDIATVYRLLKRGARAVNGDRVVLESAKDTAGVITTAEAVKRFKRRLNNLEGLVPIRAADAEKLADARLAARGL